MQLNRKVLFGLGNLILVIAITAVTNHLIQLESVDGMTIVKRLGSDLGWTSAFFTCILLIFMWIKFQYFATEYDIQSGAVLLGAVGVCTSAIIFSYSALYAMASNFGESSFNGMSATIFFSIAYIIQIISDGFMVWQSQTYRDRVVGTIHQPLLARNYIAHGIYFSRIIVCFLLFALILSKTIHDGMYENSIIIDLSTYSLQKTQLMHMLFVITSVIFPIVTIVGAWLPSRVQTA